MAASRVTLSLPLEDRRIVACPAPSRLCHSHAACMGASKITSGNFSARSPRSCRPTIAEVSSAPLSPTYFIMDPLSICASAANVAQLCGTIIRSLYKFCDDASNVDATVEGFRIETTNLQQTLVNVESTRKTSLVRNIQSLESKHWGHVNTVLKRCWKTLLKLETVLDRCASAQGIGRMPKTQIRLNMQSHSINILRKHMKSYTQALQVSLQTISIVTQWQNHDSIQGAISVLSERIEEVRVTLSARHIGRGVEDVDEGLSEADMQEEAEAVADVEKIIISAENVGKVASTSSYCPDEESLLGRNQFAKWLDSIPTTNTRRVSSNLDENRSIRTIESDSIPPDRKIPADSGIGSDATTDYDPEPETEDHFSAPVNATIVARFKDAVKQEMEAGHYQRAEVSQLSLIKHLEEGQTKHGIAYDPVQVMEDLARIYHKQKRLDEAKAIYNKLISDKKEEKEKTTDVWRWYYCLAKIYQEQDKLHYAETFAKRSFRGRENSLGEEDPLVAESVALLTQIYQQRQEHTLAKGLREYYLRDYQLPRREEIAPPEPSIQGSSDMPWPADPCYDIASPAFDPYKAMRYATERNNDIAVEDILRGTRDNKRQELATKALHWAIKAGQCKVASLLIELNVGIRKDTRFFEGKTPLIHAIEEKNEEMVQEFVRIGANLEVRCDKGITPLMYAVERGYETIAAILLSEGAFVDATVSGWTALHRATDLRNATMVELLLRDDADLEFRGPRTWCSTSTDWSWTPLLMATYAGNVSIGHILLEKLADIEARTSSGATPLMIAAEEKQTKMICLLLGAGASINAIDNEGNTALHRTIRKAGSPEVASLLLHRGADPDAANKAGETVLHVAAARTKGAALIQLLLEHRAKIEAKDISEATPLHVAIQSRDYENVKILLANGADLAEKDKNGRDAAKLAHRASPEIDDIIGRTKKQRQNSRAALSISRRGSAISTIQTETESDNLPQARNHSIATFRQRLFQKKEFHGPNG